MDTGIQNLSLSNNIMYPLINIIGAGRLGKTIARLIKVHQAGTIQGICNTTFKSAKNAIQFIGQGKPFLSIESLPPVDITIISTPDDQIELRCKQLSLSNNLKKIVLLFIVVVHYPPKYYLQL